MILLAVLTQAVHAGFLRLVLEGKNIRDRLLLSHSTPAQMKWGGGGFIYENCLLARNTSWVNVGL